MSIRFVCYELFLLLKYARVYFVARCISKTKKNFNFEKYGETWFVLKGIKIVLKRTVVPIFLPYHFLAREPFFREKYLKICFKTDDCVPNLKILLPINVQLKSIPTLLRKSSFIPNCIKRVCFNYFDLNRRNKVAFSILLKKVIEQKKQIGRDDEFWSI